MSVLIREAVPDDVPTMAQIRAAGAWTGGAAADVMARYLAGEHHPQHALAPRAMFVAVYGESLLGFIAGHHTRRFECRGELQWLFVPVEQRGTGLADRLFERMALWFASHEAVHVCVNVEPRNIAARRFYARHGARDLNSYWMVWSDITELTSPSAVSSAPAGQ